MFGRESRRNAPFDILIGKGTRVRGDIDFSGGLHLDGQVTGHVRANSGAPSTLSVSETGCIEGSAEAVNVILNGTVKGDIRASGRVALGPRSKVHGDVYYGVIETALGAEILGHLVPSSTGSGEDRAAATREEAQGGAPVRAGQVAERAGPA